MVNERELYQKRENITIKNPPPYIQYNVMPNIKICYSPALDSFHISQSKGLGKDVDKVGSYCIFSYTDMFQDPCGKAYIQCVHKVGSYRIFSYTDMFQDPCGKAYIQSVHKVGSYCIFSYTDTFQDPCGKACIQCVHSEAVSFQHVSYSHRIPRNTSLYTCGPPCSQHIFWYRV